jgi:hypothetical protein
MSLPKFLHFAALIQPFMRIGKRDFRHGFFHQTIQEEDRKWLGFEPPGYDNQCIGRFNALAFGLSQAPAKFQAITKAFIDILCEELRNIGFRGYVMAMYVDDHGQAVFNNYELVKQVEEDLAALLGMVYKTSKDVSDVTQMKFIGFNIRTDSDTINVQVPPEYLQTLREDIQTSLAQSRITVLQLQ